MKVVPLIAMAALAGCSGTVPESRMDTVAKDAPARWSATSQAKAGIDTNWVSRIGGREARALVDTALAANPDMQISAERVKRAVASAKTSGAAMRPTFSAGLNGSRTKQNFVGFPFGSGGIPSSISENFGASLMVSWEPDVWGFNRAGQEALIADAQAEGNAYRAARASLAAQVMRSWLALAEANEQVALAKESDVLLKTTLEFVRDRFENALIDSGGSASQVRLAESEIATNEAKIAQYEGSREQAVRQLEVLMGRYPKGLVKGADKLPETPSMPPAGLPSELLLRRPDILEAERRFASSGRLLKQGKLAFYPSFSVTGNTGTTTNALQSIFDSDLAIWSLAGGVTQPIWAGGALRSEYERLQSDERSALAKLQKAVLNAFGEVETALVADQFLWQREAAIQRALKSAEEATEAATEEYNAGTGDALTLITTQSNQILLASQLVSLKRLRLDNRITLHLALGGDYRVSNK